MIFCFPFLSYICTYGFTSTAEILLSALPGRKCTLQITWWSCHSLHVRVGTCTPHRQFVQLDLGNREPRGKKRLADFNLLVFMFSVQQPNTCLLQHVFTSLLKTNKVYGKEKKKTLQSVSFNSSSVAEVVGWQLCVSPSISKQCLSLKTNSCQLHSPKVFNVFAFVRHFEKCIYSSENTFKREISWLFYFRKFSEFMGILVWEEFLICMLCHDISEKYSFYNGKKHQKKISKYTV